MTRAFVAAAAAVILITGAAHAQAPSDPGKLALAQKIIDTQGGDAGMKRQMQSLLAATSRAALASLPPETRKFAAPLQQTIDNAVVALVPEVLVATKQAYADNFSEDEFRDYAVFLSSSSGQAIQRKMPAVMDQMMTALMPLMAARMPTLMRDSVREMCAQQHCTADQQQQIAAAIAKAAPSKG